MFIPEDLRDSCERPRRWWDAARQEEGDNHTQKLTAFNDGGTKLIKIRDAEGKRFDVYFDHRISTTTPGAVYLIDYPGKTKSVLVVNQRDFSQKIRVFE